MGLRWICALCLLCSGSASALGTGEKISDLRRTNWSAKEGAPSGINAITQTSDGYLWLGNSSGLFRFDGLHFDRIDLPRDERLSSANVWSLFAPASGGLWIGFSFGGAAFLKDGKLSAYADQEGLPAGSVKGFAVDRDGTPWAGTTTGLARFDGTAWRLVGPAEGYTERQTSALLVDSIGTLWAVSTNKAFFLPPGEKTFHEASVAVPDGEDHEMAESPDGSLWVASDVALQLLRKNDNPRRVTTASTKSIRFDRDGSLWWVGPSGTIDRIVRPENLTDRLSWGQLRLLSDSTAHEDHGPGDARSLTMFEDREGNVWFASSAGLFRLSERAVKPLLQGIDAGPTAYAAALVAGDAGSLWIANRYVPPLNLQDGRVVRHDELGAISCALRTDDGSVWFGGKKGLWKLASGRYEHIGLPEGADGSDIQAMTTDTTGDLWISVVRKGVFRLQRGEWRANGGIEALPNLTAVTLSTDAAGRIWFGYTEGRVAVLYRNRVDVFSEARRLPVGNVTAIYGKRSRLWAGGEFGLAILDGAGFRVVNADVGAGLSSITGIVETAQGDLWLNSRAGVVHFTAAETRRMAEDGTTLAHGEIFDTYDGVEGSSARLRPLPSAIESTDGRLWFVTDIGFYEIDPAHIKRNPLVPPVVIESLMVGDRAYAPSTDLSLPPGTTSLRIGYVGLSLTMAEKVRYRTLLDGVDTGWREAQGRREAFYTNLGPGRHRFHVIAANNDGVWNEAGASLDFVIPPTFTQTGWFVVLCAVGAVLVVWLAIRLRVRQVAVRIRGRFTERMAERERIARELHDTLLQSTQGLILRFQAVANQMAPHDPTRAMLDDALKRADAVMAEGRDRVFDLRVAAEPRGELPEAFAATGDELAQGHPAKFRVIVDGTPRRLHPVAKDEAYRIGREALVNAFRHAQATSVEIQIVYADDELRLRIRDDGIGVDAHTLGAGYRPDHWGLQGMRERALRIGGQFDLWSRPGAGTEIELVIPAAVAYLRQRRRTRWWVFARLLAGGGG